MKYVPFAGLLLLLLFASNSTPSQAQTPPQQPQRASNIIPGRYIVVFNDSVDADARTAELEAKHGFKSKQVYRDGLKGAVVEVSAVVANALRNEPQVRIVVPDRVFSIQPQTTPTGANRIEADKNAISDIDGDGSLANVDVAVIDTGVDTTHPDLNVAGGFGQFCTSPANDFTGNQCGASCGANSSFQDTNGHGTHVSGTIAARDNTIGVVGIVPGARIWAVKVLGTSGFGCFSDIIAGINWVTTNAATIEIANMSLGGYCPIFDISCLPANDVSCIAIGNSVAAGVTYAVAAGNDAADAVDYSPAHCPQAITVSAIADFDGIPGALSSVTSCGGSLDEDDTFANFSNFGADVDIAAPGKCILSTWTGGLYNTISGTSMATPHVAGAAALQKIKTPSATPAAVKAALLAQATPQASACGFTGDPDGFAEPLLYLAPCGGYGIGVFRGTTGRWFQNDQVDDSPVERAFLYGLPGDQTVVGDWDCDGDDTVGVWRSGTFFLNNQNDNSVPEHVFAFGNASDVKIAGDWDGNGCDSVGVWRGGQWLLKNQNNGTPPDLVFFYGIATDRPVVGDWDCNGTSTVGVNRGGRWFLNNQNDSTLPDLDFHYGGPTDSPIVGDWNSDGCDSISIWRAGVWHVTNVNGPAPPSTIFHFGLSTDTPVAGKWQ